MKTVKQADRQIDKFGAAAIEHEADESEAAFDAKLKLIAKQKPESKNKD